VSSDRYSIKRRDELNAWNELPLQSFMVVKPLFEVPAGGQREICALGRRASLGTGNT
jgi:hypothetical protein